MWSRNVIPQLAAFTSRLAFAAILLTNIAHAAVQLSSADHYALPPGETITLTGSGLDDATAARMIWSWRGDQTPATTNPLDANTLEVVMPNLSGFLFGYFLLVETASGSTIGIPSDYDELTSSGTAVHPSRRGIPIVVRAGAVLSGTHYYELVVVETGGVLEVADTPQLKMIIAEDGAVIDFEGAPSDFRTTLLHSPDTVIIGDTPTNSTTEQLTSIKASYGIENFNVGYPLNLAVIGDGTVLASPDQAYYTDNTYIDLTATPRASSTFSGWSGDTSSTNNPLRVQIDRAALNVTATFSPGWLLDIYEIPGVSVSTSPNSSVYEDSQTVTLTATAQTGYSFLGWGGDASGTESSISVTMDANKQVIPIVRKDDYAQLPQVTIADLFALPEGETITLTGTGLGDATAARMIWSWRTDIQNSATVNPVDANTLEVIMPSINSGFISGHYLLIETATGSTISIPSGYDELISNGTVTHPSSNGTPLVVRAGAVLSGSHHYKFVLVETGGVLKVSDTAQLSMIVAEDGAVVDFTSSPSDFRTTLLHSPDSVIIGELPPYATVEELTSIKPSYGIDTFDIGYALNLNIVGDGSVSATPDQLYYKDNTYIDLTATPGASSTFSGWSADVISTNNPLRVQIDRAALDLTATFSPGWLLNLYDVPGVSVSQSPDLSVYPDDQTITLTATAETGYTFLGWGGDARGTDPSVSITMDANKQAIPIIRKDGYEQLPQLSSADHYALPPGETITLTGSGLDDATAARMIWSWRGDQFAATTNPLDANTLEVVMPNLSGFLFGYFLLVETASGSTIGIPSGYDELTSSGTAVHPSRRGIPLVVRAGAVLSGTHFYELVVVETGGVLVVTDTPQLKMIIAEDGAVIDFEGAPSDFRTTLLHSPDTVIIGDTPTNSTTEQLTPIKASYSLNTFTVGYPLNLTIEGPGTVTVSPEKDYYASNESVQLTAIAAPDAYFIRWIGLVSGHDTTITARMRANTTQIARFSTAPDYFSTWRLEHFTTEELQDIKISSFDADPDGDSISNSAEYAFGTDPRDSTKRYKIKVDKEKVDGEFHFYVSYTRPKNALDVTYQILVSKDLATWNFNGDNTDLVYSQEISIESIDEDNEEITARLYPQSESPSVFFVRISAILF